MAAKQARDEIAQKLAVVQEKVIQNFQEDVRLRLWKSFADEMVHLHNLTVSVDLSALQRSANEVRFSRPEDYSHFDAHARRIAKNVDQIHHQCSETLRDLGVDVERWTAQLTILDDSVSAAAARALETAPDPATAQMVTSTVETHAGWLGAVTDLAVMQEYAFRCARLTGETVPELSSLLPMTATQAVTTQPSQ